MKPTSLSDRALSAEGSGVRGAVREVGLLPRLLSASFEKCAVHALALALEQVHVGERGGVEVRRGDRALGGLAILHEGTGRYHSSALTLEGHHRVPPHAHGTRGVRPRDPRLRRNRLAPRGHRGTMRDLDRLATAALRETARKKSSSATPSAASSMPRRANAIADIAGVLLSRAAARGSPAEGVHGRRAAPYMTVNGMRDRYGIDVTTQVESGASQGRATNRPKCIIDGVESGNGLQQPVRPRGLLTPLFDQTGSPVSIDVLRRALVTARARWRAGPPAERERGARGSPSEVARSAHEAGLTGGDSTPLAGLRPGRTLRSREARGSAPMRPGPRGNPEHSARADHAPTWAHAVYELHAPSTQSASLVLVNRGLGPA
jgi:hypothetical protein